MATFAQYPKYSLHVPSPVKLPPGYPVELRSIGDHIRKRRLDLGLLQIEVVAQIGVSENTVWNWKHGTQPELIHIPEVLTFLGYVPVGVP